MTNLDNKLNAMLEKLRDPFIAKLSEADNSFNAEVKYLKKKKAEFANSKEWTVKLSSVRMKIEMDDAGTFMLKFDDEEKKDCRNFNFSQFVSDCGVLESILDKKFEIPNYKKNRTWYIKSAGFINIDLPNHEFDKAILSASMNFSANDVNKYVHIKFMLIQKNENSSCNII